MRRTIDTLILLSIILIFSASASYTIYYKETEAGQYYIDYNYPDIKERVIWTDGFSKQYNESLHNFNTGYSLKSYAYIRNNAYPNTVIYSGNIIEKHIGNIATKTVMKKHIDIILDMSYPLGTIIYLNNTIDKYVYNITKDEYVKVKYRKNILNGIGNITLNVYGNAFYPDSIHWSHYRFIKNEKTFNVVNPFKKQSNTLTKEHFPRKHIQKKIRIGNIVGELSMNGNENSIAVFLPFDLRSDRYGNMYSDKAYTTYQIAQQIGAASFLFDFLGLKALTYDEMKKQILMIEQYFSKYYDNITFIAFNDLCPIVIEATDNAKIIAINPPLCPYETYEEIIYSILKRNSSFVYSSLHSFREYNTLHNIYRDIDFIDMYNRTKRLHIIISSDILHNQEIAGLKGITGEYTRISNVDRRLNSYIIGNDLYSYIKTPHINKSIINYLNKQL